MTRSEKSFLFGRLMVLLLLSVQVKSVSVSKGEEYIRRRLGESIVEEDRLRYEDLLAKSSSLRREVASLSRLLPEETATERLKQVNVELQQALRATVSMEQAASSSSNSQGSAADRAIERARKRNSIIRLEAEKKRREVEDFDYVQNMRKMELVDKTVAELQARAMVHRLDEFGISRVNDLLMEYRRMEADYIFNGTSVQTAQSQRRYIEKFIGDSQAIEITNKQRQRELLDRTVQELAARGVSFMCRPEMRRLDELLDEYREHGLRLIDLSNSPDSSSLTEKIASAQKATQAQKLTIEKYIGVTKATSTCAPSTKNKSRRQFSTKESAA